MGLATGLKLQMAVSSVATTTRNRLAFMIIGGHVGGWLNGRNRLRRKFGTDSLLHSSYLVRPSVRGAAHIDRWLLLFLLLMDSY